MGMAGIKVGCKVACRCCNICRQAAAVYIICLRCLYKTDLNQMHRRVLTEPFSKCNSNMDIFQAIFSVKDQHTVCLFTAVGIKSLKHIGINISGYHWVWSFMGFINNNKNADYHQSHPSASWPSSHPPNNRQFKVSAFSSHYSGSTLVCSTCKLFSCFNNLSSKNASNRTCLQWL